MPDVASIRVVALGAGLTVLAHARTSAQPSPDAAVARFRSGHSALAIPFELYNDHILMRVGVEGSPPFSFILDTGASQTVLSLRTAESLGLNLQAVGKVDGGIGRPPNAYLISDGLSLALPGLTLSGLAVVALPLDMMQECVGQHTARDAATRVVDGILGYNFFRGLVVEIDYDARLINLHAPASYRYTGHGTTIPLEMNSKLVFARGRIKAAGRSSIAARLLVDTGSGTALSITQQFTAAHQLLPSHEPLTPSRECGIGGAASATNVVGTVEALQLGGFTLSHPVTVFNEQPAARGYDALLGNPALRHFKVVFDYSRSRMILEPLPRGGGT